jgi:hypothetical protein
MLVILRIIDILEHFVYLPLRQTLNIRLLSLHLLLRLLLLVALSDQKWMVQHLPYQLQQLKHRLA